MIYLASPYSHKSKAVRRERFRAVCRHASKMMLAGKLVFSPIAHTHSIAEQGGLPLGWDYWKKYDCEMLKACSAVVVLMLPGYGDSKGVKAECYMAEELGIPVTFEEPSL
jgi:hypothetical protein